MVATALWLLRTLSPTGLMSLLPAAAGALVYAAALWLLRAAPAEEMRYAGGLMTSLVRRLLGRGPRAGVAPREL